MRSSSASSGGMRAVLVPVAARLTFWPRTATIAVATTIAFWPSLHATVGAIADGATIAYLAFVPTWALLISAGRARRATGREINDADVDRIVAALLFTIALTCVALATPRNPAVSAYWHIELFLPVLFLVCAAILAFGIRRVARAYPVLIFVAACFPPNIEFLGSGLGGTTFDYALVTVGYGTAAAFLALRGNVGLRVLGAACFAAVGVALAWLLRAQPPAVVYLVPTGIGTAVLVLVVWFQYRHRHLQPLPLPKWRVSSAAALIGIGVLVLAFGPQESRVVSSTALTSVRPDWLDQLPSVGFTSRKVAEYDWAPRILGDGGSAARYEVSRADATVYLDVYTSRSLGRFASVSPELLYGSTPPAFGSATFAGSTDGIDTLTSIDNRLDVAKAPGLSSWAARGWFWRLTGSGHATYQVVVVVMSRDDSAPHLVPTPTPPSYSRTVFAPIPWLLRSDTAVPAIPKYRAAELTDLARTIIATGSRPQ